MNVLPLGALSKPDFVHQVGSLSFDKLVSKDLRYKTRRSAEIIYEYGVVSPYHEIKAKLTDVWASDHFSVSERHQLYDWAIPSIPEPLPTSERHQIYDWAIPSIPEPLPTSKAFPIHDWAIPRIPEPLRFTRLPSPGRLPETMDEFSFNCNLVALFSAAFTGFVCYKIGKFVWGIVSGRRQRSHQEEMQRQEEAHQKQMNKLTATLKQQENEREKRVEELLEKVQRQEEERQNFMEQLINEQQRQHALVHQEMLAAYFLIFGILMEEVEEDPIATQTKLRQSLCKFHPDKPGGNVQKFQQVEPIYQQLMRDLEPRVHKARVARAVKEAKRARMEHLKALNMPRCLLLAFHDAFPQNEREDALKEHFETVNITPLLVAYRNRSPYYCGPPM